MTRSVRDSQPPPERGWANVNELAGRSLLITDAAVETSPWRVGEQVIVLEYKLLDWKAGESTVPARGRVTLGLKGRDWLASCFVGSNEPIGPCTFVRRETRNGQTWWSLEDADQVDLPPSDYKRF